MRWRKPVLALVLTCGAGLAAEAADSDFVGVWLSVNQPDETSVMSLIEFKADGTFREEFRKCENGEVVGFQVQSGTWTLQDGIEKTVTDRINGDMVQIEDTYRVEMLTPTERRIRMDGMNLIFTSIRVAEFRFPACPTGA